MSDGAGDVVEVGQDLPVDAAQPCFQPGDKVMSTFPADADIGNFQEPCSASNSITV